MLEYEIGMIGFLAKKGCVKVCRISPIYMDVVVIYVRMLDGLVCVMAVEGGT